MTDKQSVAEIATRLRDAAKPEILRFSACTIPGRKGYSWGTVTSSDEATIRLLCDVWNNRVAIAAHLSSEYSK